VTRITYRTKAIEGEDLVLIELAKAVAQRGGTTALAKKAGCGTAMISRIATGDYPITPRVAAALGFRLQYKRGTA